jgi:hypothetical protein
MITHELMRELLNDDLKDIQDIAEFVPNEIVYKALIIREFMKNKAIEDPKQGIREFYAFERERLQKLGFVGGVHNARKEEIPGSTRPAAGQPRKEAERNASRS